MSISSPALARLWLFLAVFFVAWTLRIALIPWTDAAAQSVDVARAIADAWRVALWLVLPVVWCVAVERIAPRAAFDQRPGANPVLAWGVGLLYLAASRGVAMWGGEDWHAIPASMPPLALFTALTGLGFVAIVEVFVFFGLVLKALRARLGFAVALPVVAALFAAIQMPGWLALLELDLVTLAALLAQVFVFGLLLGWLVRLAGTLGPAVMVHFLNNALAGHGFVA